MPRPPLTPRHRAIVIGGSLGGLLTGIALLRAGWDVQVYERVAEALEGRGAGIVTHPELLGTLAAIGITVDDSLGVRVQERIVLDRDGKRTGSRMQPQLLTAWGHLYQVLRSAFPDTRYHNGKQLVALTQDEQQATARFADGSEDSAALLIAADGIRSVVRQALLPDAKPQYAGYVAWRGLVEEACLTARTRAELFPYFGFGVPPQEQILGYPVAGRHNAVVPGARRYNFVWYRPAEEGQALRDMVTDANGKVWSDGIPPPLIRNAVLADARAAAHTNLAPQFAEIVNKTENLFFQPIFDLESTRLAFGRVALLGDAAFVARPHCGMGVTKAASDAQALVEALGYPQTLADVPAALQAYEHQRAHAGRAVVQHARALGAYMQAQTRTAEEQAMATRYRSPESIMRETAVPPRREFSA